jgi:hypothetical protein
MFQQVTTKSKEMKSKEDFVQHYKEVRARLTGHQPKKEQKIEIIPVILESNAEKIQVIGVTVKKTKSNILIHNIIASAGMTREEVFSVSKKRKFVLLRFKIWNELSKFGFSLFQIAKLCRPNKPYDHATILNGIRQHRKNLKKMECDCE